MDLPAKMVSMNRFTFIAVIIIAAGIFYFNKKSAKPVPVKPIAAAKINTPAPVEVIPEKSIEAQPVTEEAITPIEVEAPVVAEKPVEVPIEEVPQVVPEVVPEGPIMPEPAAKVLMDIPKDDEDRLSTEDKIEDLEKHVKLFRNELNALYKDKVLIGSYSSTDKVQNLKEDAIEYLKDPEKYVKGTPSEMVIAVKQFLENVKKARLEASKPR